MSSKNWVFLTPISNLKITSSVNNEICIDRVTFISGEKLINIRDRLGIKKSNIKLIDKRLGKNRITPTIKDLFKTHETFALVRQTGTKEQVKPDCFRKVSDELLILNLSRLFFERRKYSGFLSLEGSSKMEKTTHILLDSNSTAHNLGFKLLTSPLELSLDQQWLQFQNNFFFLDLLKILKKKKNVSKNWRESLRRAAIFAGKSLNTNNIADALLWNIVALESLITNQGESISTVLIDRIKALIGWHGNWISDDYEKQIQNIYNLRSAYIHDGIDSKIDKDSLLFSDKLVFNVFLNLVTFSNYFPSKNKFIEFSNKTEALNTLGYKLPKHPSLKFVNQTYTSQQIQLI